MQYLFRGHRKETGEPVEGRVTAPTRDVADDILVDNGIVAEALTPDLAAQDDTAATVSEPQAAPAPQPAIDDAGLHISFDELTRRYQGHSASVLDRERIRKHMMELVDDAVVHDLRDAEQRRDARLHIAQVLEKIFQDRQALGPDRPTPSRALQAEMSELAGAVARIESAMASMSLAVRRAGHGELHRTAPQRTALRKTHADVLTEIFESNLELIRGVKDPASLPADGLGR